MRHGEQARRAGSRRGTALILVVGMLAIVAVLAAAYTAIGRADRRLSTVLAAKRPTLDVPEIVAEYHAEVFRDDLFSGTWVWNPAFSGSPSGGAGNFDFVRDMVDLPYVDPVIRWDAGATTGGYAAELVFTPSGNHPFPPGAFAPGRGAARTAQDPWLGLAWSTHVPDWIPGASGTSPMQQGATLAQTRVPRLRAGATASPTMNELRQYGWYDQTGYLKIANFAPSGLFVNLFNLRGNFSAEPGVGTYQDANAVDREQMSNEDRLFLLTYGGRANFPGVVEATRQLGPSWGFPTPQTPADYAYKPAYMTMHQRHVAGIPASSPIVLVEGGGRVATWADAEFPLYSYADANGDGVLDARWWELKRFDGSIAGGGQWLDLLPAGEFRWFIASHSVDLSSLINVNVATDGLTVPTLEKPWGLTPEIDLRRWLTQRDFSREARSMVDDRALFTVEGPSGRPNRVVGDPLSYAEFAQPREADGRLTQARGTRSSFGSTLEAGERGLLGQERTPEPYELSLASGVLAPEQSGDAVGLAAYFGIRHAIDQGRFVAGSGQRLDKGRSPLALVAQGSPQVRTSPAVEDALLPWFLGREGYSRLAGSTIPTALPEVAYGSWLKRRYFEQVASVPSASGSLVATSATAALVPGPVLRDVAALSGTAGANLGRGLFGIDDLAELLRRHGINDDSRMSRLEQSTDGQLQGLGTTPAQQSVWHVGPLRSTRATDVELEYQDAMVVSGAGEMERGEVAEPDGVPDASLMAWWELDLRRTLTTVSFANELRPVRLSTPQYDTIVRPNAQTRRTTSAAGGALPLTRVGEVFASGFKVHLPTLLEDLTASAVNQSDGKIYEELITQVALTLAPTLVAPGNSTTLEPLVWQFDDSTNAALLTTVYGHTTPELAVRMSGHLALNLLDGYDTDTVPRVATVLLNRNANAPVRNATEMTPDVSGMNVFAFGEPVDLKEGVNEPVNSGQKPERLAVQTAYLPGVTGPVGSAPPAGRRLVDDAVNLVGIEAHPVITEVMTMSVYCDIPESLGGDGAVIVQDGASTGNVINGDRPGEWEQLVRNPIPQLPTIRGGRGRDVGGGGLLTGDDTGDPAGNALVSDLIFQVFAVQLTNPHDVPIVVGGGTAAGSSLPRPVYYLEWSDRYFLLGGNLDGFDGGSTATVSALVIEPGHSLVVYALSDADKNQLAARWESIRQASGAGGKAIDRAYVIDWLNNQLSGRFVGTPGKEMAPKQMLIFDPVDRRGGTGSGDGYTVLGSGFDDLFYETNGLGGWDSNCGLGEVRLWAEVRDAQSEAQGSANNRSNDILLDRIREPQAVGSAAPAGDAEDRQFLDLTGQGLALSDGDVSFDAAGSPVPFVSVLYTQLPERWYRLTDQTRVSQDSDPGNLRVWGRIGGFARPWHPDTGGGTGASSSPRAVARGVVPAWMLENPDRTRGSNYAYPPEAERLAVPNIDFANLTRHVALAGDMRAGPGAYSGDFWFASPVGTGNFFAVDLAQIVPTLPAHPDEKASVAAAYLSGEGGLDREFVNSGYRGTNQFGSSENETLDSKAVTGVQTRFALAAPSVSGPGVATPVVPAELDLGNDAFSIDWDRDPLTTNDRFSRLRTVDLLRTMVVGAVNRPDGEPSAVSEGEWVTLGEHLGYAMNFFQPRTDGNAAQLDGTGAEYYQLYHFNRDAMNALLGSTTLGGTGLYNRTNVAGDETTRPAKRISGVNLVFDDFAPYYNGDGDMDEYAPRVASSGTDIPVGDGKPLALSLLDLFTTVPADDDLLRVVQPFVGATAKPDPQLGLTLLPVQGRLNINTMAPEMFRMLPGFSPSIDFADVDGDGSPSAGDVWDWWPQQLRQWVPGSGAAGDVQALATNPAFVVADAGAAAAAWRDRQFGIPRTPSVTTADINNPALMDLRPRSGTIRPWAPIDRLQLTLNNYTTDTGRANAVNPADGTGDAPTNPPIAGLREQPGFLSPAELALVRGNAKAGTTNGNAHNAVDHLGVDGLNLGDTDAVVAAIGGPGTLPAVVADPASIRRVNGAATVPSAMTSAEASVFGVADGTTGSPLTSRMTPVNGDQFADDYEERLAVLAATMNSVTTRTDVAAVWFVLHGYRERDVASLAPGAPMVPTVARRFVMVLDRSAVRTATDMPRVLHFEEVPY